MIELVMNLGDKNMKNQVEASFYVEDDIPQLSTCWPKNIGTWFSWSELLGKGVSGPYWTPIPRFTDASSSMKLS